MATGAVIRVEVPVPGAEHHVTVGPGLLDRVHELVERQDADRAALIGAAPVLARYGARVATSLGRLGVEAHTVEVPDGEGAKTLATVERCCRRLARIPLRRGDLVVALGGGVVGDLAGFVAASWHRGTRLVQLPTTLLAQVDAAIGGKTAVNLPEGKNLVGAFHQPVAVVADTGTLLTLPERERRAGLGEVAKYGFIRDPAILELLERAPEQAAAGAPALARELVARSAAIKAAIVAADERESGQRMLLNYGHTVGHAIEALGGYTRWRHGEAVALGMVFAARLGERLGVSAPGLADRTERLLSALGLPTGGVPLDPAQVWPLLARDKKATRRARFVLCPHPGTATVTDQVPPALVDEVLATLA